MGAGNRGLMRGMATLPQGNQELLVVKDKGELGVSKSLKCDIFGPTVLWHCCLGDKKGIRPEKDGYWFVDGDNMTGALHVL